MRTTLTVLFVLVLTAACAGDGRKPVPVVAYEGPIPGTIGIVVANQSSGVVVMAVRAGSPAARADVRAGDRISACNGEPVLDERQFEQRVLDSRFGSVMELEIVRSGESRRISLPVDEIATAVQV